MLRRLIFTFLMLMPSLFSVVKAQELICNVDINTQQVSGIDQTVIEALKTSIYEFMNNRQWTGYNLELEERISCSILLNIKVMQDNTYFEADLTIALLRPVYNSTYNSPIFNYIDKDVKFDYIKGQPLEFNVNQFYSNLTSILGYYSYFMLGLYFDSFAYLGGTPFLEACNTVVSTAQGSSYAGWKSFDGQRNRYWLIENFTNPAYEKLRQFYYEYHRMGLDQLYDNADLGRANAAKSLPYIQDVSKVRSGLLAIQVITEAKRDEIINVFSEGSTTEKQKVVEVMTSIDPSHTNDYEKIAK